VFTFKEVTDENNRLFWATGKLPMTIAMNQATCRMLVDEAHTGFFGIDKYCGMLIELDETIAEGHFELRNLQEIKKA
jgi:hypothetical protein